MPKLNEETPLYALHILVVYQQRQYEGFPECEIFPDHSGDERCEDSTKTPAIRARKLVIHMNNHAARHSETGDARAPSGVAATQPLINEIGAIRAISSFAKQIVQSRFCSFQLRRVFGYVCVRFRLEVITKIRFVFLSLFLSRGLFAMFCVARIVFHAHFADMEFRTARVARIEPPQRQAECAQGRSATPANQTITHRCGLL